MKNNRIKSIISSKSTSDRKKLEPIKNSLNSNLNLNSSSTSHVDPTSTTMSNGGGHSLSENDNTPNTATLNNHSNDDEPSMSENTLSSDKQLPASQLIKMKKVKIQPKIQV